MCLSKSCDFNDTLEIDGKGEVYVEGYFSASAQIDRCGCIGGCDSCGGCEIDNKKVDTVELYTFDSSGLEADVTQEEVFSALCDEAERWLVRIDDWNYD